MKLVEALAIAKGATLREGAVFGCFLATGFNPLHFSTFLTAELGLLFADQKIEVGNGLYGDLLGNVGRLEKADADDRDCADGMGRSRCTARYPQFSSVFTISMRGHCGDRESAIVPNSTLD